jgi:hypothetical protein
MAVERVASAQHESCAGVGFALTLGVGGESVFLRGRPASAPLLSVFERLAHTKLASALATNPVDRGQTREVCFLCQQLRLE